MIDTIPARFRRLAAAHASQPLFFTKQAGRYHPITWGQTADTVDALAAYLLHEGLTPCDRVIVLSENRPEWGMADLAIQTVGAWVVPLYPTLTADDLAVIVRDCEPLMAIASTPEQVSKLCAVQQRQPTLRRLICMEATAQTDLVLPWTRALEQGRRVLLSRRQELEVRQDALRPEQTATLIYTSGTTGIPKGVMLSHHNFLSNADACGAVIPIRADDVHLSFLPLSHVFERLAGWYLMFSTGAAVAYAESMDTVPQNLQEVHPTIILGVPRFFEKLYARVQEALRQAPGYRQRLFQWAMRTGRTAAAYKLAGKPLPWGVTLRAALAHRLVFHKLHARLGGRLRFCVTGSAPLSTEIAEFFFAAGVTILEGYGMTESSPVIAVNSLDHPRFGSVGRPLPGVDVRIADDGEILTRGDHVMQGYYRKPQETAEAIKDGWLCTGDIGHLDEEGYLWITDRKKDLIKTAGGKFVAPQKLENLLLTDPAISQAFVFGDKRPYCVALVVPNFEVLKRVAQAQGIHGATPRDLVQNPTIHAYYWQQVQAKQAGLARFEQVKRIALLDHEFSQAAGELTPTLKVKRKVIAERCQTILDGLYQAQAGIEHPA